MAKETNWRVGLVGCGFMGRMHRTVYANLEGVQLAAVCDVQPESARKFADADSLKVYTDLDALLADPDIDVIDVCLPTYLHAEASIKAMRAGKHVVCEKPMALHVAEAEAMIATRNETGKALMIAHCIRFWPEYAILKQYVDDGSLGALRSANFTRYGAFPSWSWENWLANEDLAGGGALDMHIHDTDFALYLLGGFDDVRSFGSVDGTGVCHIFTAARKGEAVVQLEGGWNLPQSTPFKMSFRAVFERGFLNWDGGPLTVYEEGKEPFQPPIERRAAAAGGNISDMGGYYHELRYFFDCLNAGKPFERVTPESSLASLKAALKEIEMVKAGGK